MYTPGQVGRTADPSSDTCYAHGPRTGLSPVLIGQLLKAGDYSQNPDCESNRDFAPANGSERKNALRSLAGPRLEGLRIELLIEINPKHT